MVYALREWSKAEEFGGWLQQHRKQAGKTQEEVARLAKCSKGYISFLERAAASSLTGKPMRPTEEMAEKLAFALGRPIEEGRVLAGYAPSSASVVVEQKEVREQVDLPLLEAFLRDLPPNVQQEQYNRIKETWLEWKRSQTDFGRRSSDE